MIKGDRVVLTSEARERFPDIGTRAGTVMFVDSLWVGVLFDGRDFHSILPTYEVEEIAK